MNARNYSALASHYDSFTLDVPYETFADFYESQFKKHRLKPRLLLDLACGTGTLTWLMASRGYEMIGADSSCDMLIQSYSKTIEGCVPPIFLNQSMMDLDLYGTIEGCICSLDSINYVTDPEELIKVFSRVFLFLEPGGIFIFDYNTISKIERLDKTVYTRENEQAFCVYQADYENRILTYALDIFEKRGKLYTRSQEYHCQRAYTREELYTILSQAGFDYIESNPSHEEGREYITAIKPKEKA